MVQYRPDEDLGLDMHTDDSDVTFNVCLGRGDFEGAGLTFCGPSATSQHRRMSFRYKHVKGRCVVHLGSRRHGADDIVSGERSNLIIWNTNLAFRRSARRHQPWEKEDAPPDPECLSYTHDRDYAKYKSFAKDAKGKSRAKLNAERAWCPPQGSCYDGMEPIDPFMDGSQGEL